MGKSLLVLSALFILLFACGNSHSGPKQIVNQVQNPKLLAKSPIVNFYLDNSLSMAGYVNGNTEFKEAISDYLTNIKIANCAADLNLFHVNSIIIPKGKDITKFNNALAPSTFTKAGGDQGSTDIPKMLKLILSKTSHNTISIFVTDGIFSPGKGKIPSDYLPEQRREIKEMIAEHIKNYPKTGVILYQRISNFDGYYYNCLDKPIKANEQRPYYIWIIGATDQIDMLSDKVPIAKFKGGGVTNVFSITSMNKKINYAVKVGSGKFRLDQKNPKTAVSNWGYDTKSNKHEARMSIDADMSGLLLNDTYLMNAANYLINLKEIKLQVKRAASNPFGYSHTIALTTNHVSKMPISIKLNANMPAWINKANDDRCDVKPESNKTFGIKYQIEGIYEAFTYNCKQYTEIIINIQ